MNRLMLNQNFIIWVVPLLLLMSACSEDQKNSLEGKWELVAVLADPGDGSGTFMPATIDKYLDFKPDSLVTSNVSHCVFSKDKEEGKSGTYSVRNSEIAFTCENKTETYSFLLAGKELILNFPRCIEPCQEKYRRIQ